MSKYYTPGNITALMAICSILAGAFGKTALAHFFDDPTTSQTFFTVMGSVGTLIAGMMKGVNQ